MLSLPHPLTCLHLGTPRQNHPFSYYSQLPLHLCLRRNLLSCSRTSLLPFCLSRAISSVPSTDTLPSVCTCTLIHTTLRKTLRDLPHLLAALVFPRSFLQQTPLKGLSVFVTSNFSYFIFSPSFSYQALSLLCPKTALPEFSIPSVWLNSEVFPGLHLPPLSSSA